MNARGAVLRPRLLGLVLTLALATTGNPAQASGTDHSVSMYEKDAATYYVRGFVEGLGDVEMMVDTGSGYVTINEYALARLTRGGATHARFIKNLQGILADGQEIKLPVYAIGALRIGPDCWLHDVQAAVFPGRTRYILGLSALAKAAPFTFSLKPPRLILSHCEGETDAPPTLAASDD